MAEFDAYAGYPEPKEPRLVSPTRRTIANRIAASYRDREFYDGARENGYGGMKDDGRWAPIARSIKSQYGLKEGDRVLQVRAHKGFLLRALFNVGMRVTGCETSPYAIEQAQVILDLAPMTKLPYEDGEFDIVIAANVV